MQYAYKKDSKSHVGNDTKQQKEHKTLKAIFQQTNIKKKRSIFVSFSNFSLYFAQLLVLNTRRSDNLQCRPDCQNSSHSG
tara:strand:- start:1194 stop:1433 length:240 start_codon:yes stop_codon:yes gene_type:complete